jgi:hypothetical protein
MKKITCKTNWRITVLAAVAVVAGLGSSALRVQAQTSPNGTWDFVLSGNQRGVAQIIFDQNTFTLAGTEILTTKQKSNSSDDVGDDSRGDTDPISNVVRGDNIYGRVGLSGIWTYDIHGRVIGVIVENGGTNGVTNGISFRAVVKRRATSTNMTMTAIREGRSITYRGAPLRVLPNISGNYYGLGKKAGLPFTELFALAPTGVNRYGVDGAGPNYTYTGEILLSAKNQIAFFGQIGDPTNALLRAIVGSYHPTKGKGTLNGVMETPDGSDVDNVNLKIFRQPL